MRNRERQLYVFSLFASWVLTAMLVCALLGVHGPEKGGSMTVQALKETASVIQPLIGPLGADAAPSARLPDCAEDHQRRLLDHTPCVQTETFKRYACRRPLLDAIVIAQLVQATNKAYSKGGSAAPGADADRAGGAERASCAAGCASHCRVHSRPDTDRCTADSSVSGDSC